MTQTPLKNNSQSSSTSTLNIVLYVILGIVAIAITAIIAFLHFKTLKQQRDKKLQQRENALVEPTENHQQHNENEESSAPITTENDNSAAETEDATAGLFGNRYVSSDMGKEEEISFEGTSENPTIKYSAAHGATSLLGKENNSLYFLNAPAVKYYVFNVNENGFSLKNPDGKIQTFMMVDTD
jgi:cytoskeletal protein RodZ